MSRTCAWVCTLELNVHHDPVISLQDLNPCICGPNTKAIHLPDIRLAG